MNAPASPLKFHTQFTEIDAPFKSALGRHSPGALDALLLLGGINGGLPSHWTIIIRLTIPNLAG